MLYYLLYPLRDVWFGFNVFKYITFRAAMATLTAFLVTLILGPIVIAWLKRLKFGQYIRKEHVKELYDLHQHKQHTPTMGGLLIILAIVSSTLLWADLLNKYLLMTIGAFVLFGAIGFIDDYAKIRKKHNEGLSARRKFAGQVAIGVAIALFIMTMTEIPTKLALPFTKGLVFDMGVFYILFVVLVIVGSSNAVNLTDGLDGLAIGCTVIAAFVYALLSYMTGNAKIADYLNIFFLPGAGELTVFMASMVGAGLGFLWFNSYPASVFMGDTGSLALGGAIGTVAVFIKKEILLAFVGAIFVAEALSVILQVIWFKTTKRRLFLMAPVHHHFERLGWVESKVIIRFWIVAIMAALFSLVTLKMQ